MGDINGAAEVNRKAAKLTCERPKQPGTEADLTRTLEDAIVVFDELERQFRQTRAMGDLNRVIHGTDNVLSVMPTNHPHRISFLNDLSYFLGYRFKQMGPAGNMKDIDRAIEVVASIARQICSRDDPKRVTLLHNLCQLLGTRYIRSRMVDDVKLAIEAAEEALELIPDGCADAARHLTELAISFGRLFENTHDPESLERAIEAAEKAAAIPIPSRSLQQNTLARLLGMRFEQTGVLSDLDRAIDILSQSLSQLPHGHPNSFIALNYLGILLGIRFEQQGAAGDLDSAIQCLETSAGAPHRDADRAARLNNLAARLNCYPGDPQRADWLGNLGTYFGMRYKHESGSSSDDLDKAIHYTKDAIELIGAGNPQLLYPAGTLANLLRDRYRQRGEIDDLNEAIDFLTRVLSTLPENHKDRAILLYGLGQTVEMRYTRTRAAKDLDRSKEAFHDGWTCENTPPKLRIHLATKIAGMLASQSNWEETATYLEQAVGELHALSPRHLQNTDKQHMLRSFAGLSGSAAAAALHAGKEASHALQLLELGRGIISGLLLDMRTDLSSLKQEYPDWADEFSRLRDQLDSAGDSNNLPKLEETLPLSSWQSQEQSRRKAEDQFLDILAKIRKQRGFEEFLLPPTAHRLMEAADPDPIVVVNVSPIRCDAFLVEKHQVRVQELPNLSLPDIINKRKQMRRNPESLASILAWLWDVIVHPILDALGFDRTLSSDDDWPHIWWIPVGPLNSMPLHAAGYHERFSGETALDRVMSSYSSSIKSLLAGRLEQPIRHTPAHALLVSMPKTPGQSPLHFAESEVAMLDDLCPSLGLTSIKPPESRRDILNQLRTCKIFHFAGHGHVDPSEPSRSCLLLRDWEQSPLTVGDIRDQKLQDNGPFLAYLSACSTGANEVLPLVDEAVHLISACQLAGFRHVVGTLWEVSDGYCVKVAQRLYETIRDEGITDAAVYRGLHRALRELRDAQFDRAGTSGIVRSGRGVAGAANWEDMASQEGDAGRKAVAVGLRRSGYLWVPYIHFGV